MLQNASTASLSNFDEERADIPRVAKGVRSFFHKTFNKMHCEGPPIDIALMRELSVMPVCTHRSQADYFILGLFLYDMGLRKIRYAAGDNLTDLPFLGKQFRALGAFPVSRSRTSNRSYVRTLCDQVTDMLIGGDNVVVFPEGGRSYKGHMMEMKNGMIGACLMAQWRNPDDAYHFFPVAISYERLPELLYFDMLQKGKRIRSEKKDYFNSIWGNMCYFGADVLAFSKFVFANRINKNYGDVYIDYGEPIHVGDLVDLKALHNPKARDEFMAHRSAMSQVGEFLHRRFLSLYRLLPMHILAAILTDDPQCSRTASISLAGELREQMRALGRNTKSLDGLSAEQIVDKGIEQLIAFNALSLKRDSFQIRKPSVIHYHAASIKAP